MSSAGHMTIFLEPGVTGGTQRCKVVTLPDVTTRTDNLADHVCRLPAGASALSPDAPLSIAYLTYRGKPQCRRPGCLHTVI
jgi:hypothetical protein